MENFISVLFDSRKVKKNVVETMLQASGQGLNEDTYEAVMFEHENGGIGIRVSIPNELTDEESDRVADELAEALFNKGYDNFEIETSVTESQPPKTFKPTHFHKSNLFGAKTKLMYHNGEFYHMKADEEGRKQITRWNPGPMGVNNRSKLNPASVDGEIVNGKYVEYPEGTTFADAEAKKSPQTSSELDADSKDSGTGRPDDAPAKEKEKPVVLRYAERHNMVEFYEKHKKDDKAKLIKLAFTLLAELNEMLLLVGESTVQQEIHFLLNEGAMEDKQIAELVHKLTILVGLGATKPGGPNHRLIVDAIKRAEKSGAMDRAGQKPKVIPKPEQKPKDVEKPKEKEKGMDAKEAEVRKKFARFIALLDLASGKSKKVMASMYTESLDALTADERKELDSLYNELQDGDIVDQLSGLGLDVAKQLNRYLDLTKDKKPEDKPATDTKNLDTFAKSDKGGLANDPDEVEAIKELQRALGFEGDDVDGKYGPKTIEAVKKFQEENGLTVDGDAGPETIAKIQELIASDDPDAKKKGLTKDQKDALAGRGKYAPGDKNPDTTAGIDGPAGEPSGKLDGKDGDVNSDGRTDAEKDAGAGEPSSKLDGKDGTVENPYEGKTYKEAIRIYMDIEDPTVEDAEALFASIDLKGRTVLQLSTMRGDIKNSVLSVALGNRRNYQGKIAENKDIAEVTKEFLDKIDDAIKNPPGEGGQSSIGGYEDEPGGPIAIKIQDADGDAGDILDAIEEISSAEEYWQVHDLTDGDMAVGPPILVMFADEGGFFSQGGKSKGRVRRLYKKLVALGVPHQATAWTVNGRGRIIPELMTKKGYEKVDGKTYFYFRGNGDRALDLNGNEISSTKLNENIETFEETYDGDDFFNAYGVMYFNDDEVIDEAEYQGRKVKLGKPMRGDVKKFKVYVKNPKGNVVKVNFGDPNMKIKKSNPERRRSFRARHNCDNPGPRHKARYWSCRKW